MYKWHGLLQEACTSALLLRSPARELRPTLHCAGPTRQGDDTMCPELEKTGPEARKSPTRQGGVVPTLCCAVCGQQYSCGTAGTRGTRQTCASLPTWDRS